MWILRYVQWGKKDIFLLDWHMYKHKQIESKTRIKIPQSQGYTVNPFLIHWTSYTFAPNHRYAQCILNSVSSVVSHDHSSTLGSPSNSLSQPSWQSSARWLNSPPTNLPHPIIIMKWITEAEKGVTLKRGNVFPRRSTKYYVNLKALRGVRLLI